MDSTDLLNRFEHHPPSDARIVQLHESVRRECLLLANYLNGLVPDGREKSLAITHLEEVMYWANAAIARNQSSIP